MSLADELAAILRPIVQAAVRDALEGRQGTAPEYMSPEQAGQLCGVEAATVRAWVKAGQLTAYRAGRLLRVSRAELERYLRRAPGADDDAEVAELAQAALGRRRKR